MDPSEAPATPSPSRLLETVTRTLRHEVGDLLQTVYSTVAILQERVPPDAKLERRFLADLRARAETCKHELDAVHDLVLPITLKYGLVDLAELASMLTAAVGPRYSGVEVRAESSGPLPITADAQRLEQAGRLLLINLCQSARGRVEVRTAPGPGSGEVHWSLTNDGYGATPEQLLWLKTPFATTQQALFGLGLALARRVVELHGGRVEAENRDEGGFRVSLILPANPPS